ncbi:MAG: hypothetical protein NTV22_03640 [bacterium]|nr:hypothetical protein [bacterium]
MSSLEQYGHFDHDAHCFVLEHEPPRKWVNLHYNAIGEHEVYAEITNIGDGPVWVRDGQGCTCQLVGYDAKYLYVRDDDNGVVFCPGGAPAPQAVAQVTCRYYAAKTEIQGTCADLRATQRVFVPHDYCAELWTVSLENLADTPRHVSLFAYAMFQLTGCDRDGAYVSKDNYAVVMPELGGVFITNRNRHVPTNRFNGYLVALNGFVGGNGYRDHFTRSEFALGTPRILWGWNCDNRPGFGPDCAGVVQVRLTLAPRATGRVDFALGQAASPDDVLQLRRDLTPARIDARCDEQHAREMERAAMYRVETGFPNYDALINIFVKKQHYAYLINKSGFRDNLQLDCALAMADYPAARANLLRALASQYANGCVPHGFRPFNRLQYSDKPAWILMSVPWLIKESGDFALLEQPVPYLDSNECGTVLDHAVRALRFLAGDTGKHGLCLQHHADWNDGLEATAAAGARESVMVSQQLCHGALELEELAQQIGDAALAREARAIYDRFARQINEVAWDGRWYVRTFCEDGYRIGSHANKEGRIFLNTQSWAILARIAPPERARLCMQAVDELLACDVGYRICAPGFSAYDPRVGRMSNSMPGYVENGGCYNHAAGFKGIADCLLGRAEQAWETFVKVTPDNPRNPIARSEAEPFSFNNTYATCDFIYGKAGYPWRTGTAAWFAMLLLEYILGARRGYRGLIIAPCLPKAIPHARVLRTFRGARYDITLDNSAGRGVGARSISVDGTRITGNVLPLFSSGTHQITVVV